MHKQIKAPFTSKQVKGLNQYQKEGMLHNFTCGNPKHPDYMDDVLIASKEGWSCPSCNYKQDWAWNFMADGSMIVERVRSCPSSNHDKEEE